MDYWVKANRVIKTFVESGGADTKPPVIYPYGMHGMMVKEILNKRFGIQEVCIADNLLANVSRNKGIIPVSNLVNLDMEGRKVLLAQQRDFKTDTAVRLELLKYVSIENVIDIFSPSMYFDSEVYDELPYSCSNSRMACMEVTAREIYRNSVDGAIAECGVYRAGFARWMSVMFPERKFYLFDTFKGFDVRDVSNPVENLPSDFWQRWNYAENSSEIALVNIPYRTNTVVREGYFPETAVGLEDERFAFVSLDTDLYKPIYEGLKFFYPRLNPGGIIFVHDLGNPGLQGVSKAVMQFCREQHVGYSVIPSYLSNGGCDARSAVLAKPY